MENIDATPIGYHIPALLPEAINLLITNPEGIYIDATFGGGGHSREILKNLNDKGRLFSFDRDLDAYENRIEDHRFAFVHSNFRFIENFMRYHSVEQVDGILADLGVSFHHFDTAERGFSFRNDAPLDMRMTREAPVTAASVIEKADEKELNRILRTYADLKRPGNVVSAIIKAREKSPITTTLQLADAVEGALDQRQIKKELSQVFQAFRIETNHEMTDLAKFLEATLKVIKPGGRLVVLTYHSVEDKMVKNFMKTGNIAGETETDFFGNRNSPWEILTRKPIEPTEEEIERNPRCRSAKLRAAEKI